MMPKINKKLSFPATKLRNREELYAAIERVMTGDLGLGEDMYFIEKELPVLKNRTESQRFSGLEKDYFLYPVEVSLSEISWKQLELKNDIFWYTIDEMLEQVDEGNIIAITKLLKELSINNTNSETGFDLGPVKEKPSMDAMANQWAKKNDSGIRKLSRDNISEILNSGDRAFNLRVADPYLSYQRQGMGFTWSFFTPKDKQDLHVHSQPAVEIYGIMEGRFVLWHKPMYERGALVWNKEVLNPGDWIEVEALHCHFGYWATKEGYGTVIKAAGAGELAGVGRIGISGKTVCKDCQVEKQCQKHPHMLPVLNEFQKKYDDRDWEIIYDSII